MDTPICDFVRNYADGEPLRFHMPGHKGQGSPLDITEIPGADVLYRAEGIIAQSRENAAKLFGAAETFYSAEGSSLCIRAMVFLLRLYAEGQGKPLRLAAFRNAHRTFVTACALLDADVQWISPQKQENLLSCRLTGEELEEQLNAMAEPPLALYVTSPDYLGQPADLQELSRICRRRKMLLLVDNAHGAYLRFLPRSQHPMDLGADLCCDSAHKTLPVLTGGAYLHISAAAPELFRQQAEQALALFASTSPSYLILQSMDAANACLQEEFPSKLAAYLPLVAACKEQLQAAGYGMVGQEPLKLSLSTKPYGWEGAALAAELEKQNIYAEFSDPDYIVFMLSPLQGEAPLKRLTNALLSIERRAPIATLPPPLPVAEQVCSPKEALFAPSERIAAEQSLGRVLSDAEVTCPPAVPILMGGQRIDEAALRCFRYYGHSHLRVIKE